MGTEAEARKPDPDFAGMSPPTTGLLNHPVIGSAITPITLALTGMLYLTGWTERNVLLKQFGVSASVVPEPIQNTLARGYTPLLVGVTGSAIILAALYFMLTSLSKWLEDLLESAAVSTVPDNWRGAVHRSKFKVIYVSLLVYGMLLALLVSHGSGSISAFQKADHAREVVAGRCNSCFKSRIHGRDIAGKVLAQNDARTVLLTRQGVLLIKTEDIAAVYK